MEWRALIRASWIMNMKTGVEEEDKEAEEKNAQI
jgi:hypothetical protein